MVRESAYFFYLGPSSQGQEEEETAYSTFHDLELLLRAAKIIYPNQKIRKRNRRRQTHHTCHLVSAAGALLKTRQPLSHQTPLLARCARQPASIIL